MSAYIIKSYAKINLSLNVVGKSKNRLHKIESIVTFLKLSDKKALWITVEEKTAGKRYEWNESTGAWDLTE